MWLLLAGCALLSESDLADRMDVDGDGVARPADCDDGDASTGAEYVDGDADGHGSDVLASLCDASDGVVLLGDASPGTRTPTAMDMATPKSPTSPATPRPAGSAMVRTVMTPTRP